MSKKKKAAPGKAGKKLPVKKSAKKAVKPVAKKKTAKALPSRAKVKKPATKSLPKSKPAPKKITVKKVVKKAISKIKQAIKSKKVAKKTISPPKKNLIQKNHPGKKSNKNNKTVTGSGSKSHVIAKKAEPVKKSPSKPARTVPVNVSLKGKQAPHLLNGSDKNKDALKSKQQVANDKPVKPLPVPEGRNSKTIEPFSRKQQGDKKPAGVLAISNTIPVNKKNEISASKIASISYSITNPVRRTDSYAIKAEKEPGGKFELEFVVHASAEMLYEFLSTPSGLSEWFCDDLNIRNGIYTFIWDDQLQQARLLKTVELQLVRFQWVDKTDGSYFEFRIQRDDLTNDISLIITDFAETASERESSKLLWHSQVEKLMHVIGSIF